MKVLIDTNILIDHLNGVPEAALELSLHHDVAISTISWLEVMRGTTAQSEERARSLLAPLRIIDIDPDICEYAFEISKLHKIDLADALILATAQATGRILVTRDKHAAEAADNPLVRVPYQL